MTTPSTTTHQPDVPGRHRLTARDFHRMVEAGILGEDDRIELIDGELIDMAPTGPWDENVVDLLQRALQARLFQLKLENQYRVRVQNAISLSSQSETYPDVAVVKERTEGYATVKPTVADTLLVIEVRDSSEDYDRNTKAVSYAKAGVPEYWIVSRATSSVTVFTIPTQRGYKVTYVAQDETIECKGVNGLSIDTTGLF